MNTIRKLINLIEESEPTTAGEVKKELKISGSEAKALLVNYVSTLLGIAPQMCDAAVDQLLFKLRSTSK